MSKKEQPKQILDYLVPDSTELEMHVLSDLCQEPTWIPDILPLLHPDFFTSEATRKTWNTIVSFYNEGKTINPMTILEAVGPEFAQIYAVKDDLAGSYQYTTQRAASLRHLAAKKRAYYATVALMELINTPGTTEQDIFAGMESFSRTIEGPKPINNEKDVANLLDVVEEEVEKTSVAVAKGETIRITTGFRAMDGLLNGGFKAGQLIVLAARPSVGKTALMLQIARGAAEDGNPVQIFSLEMTGQELAERLLCSTGHMKTSDISLGRVTPDNFEKAKLELAGLPIYINDFSRGLDDIISRISLAVRKDRCKIAFIDYLGLLSDALNFGNAKLYQAIARITGTLKATAKRLGIPIVLLCQLNREQAREGRSPELFDLRDSGSIEQDADVVLMLEQNVLYEGVTYPLVAWLRKNRSGKREYGFTFIPNETYSHFTASDPIPPKGEAPAEPAKAPIEIPANVNGINDDLPEDDGLPF